MCGTFITLQLIVSLSLIIFLSLCGKIQVRENPYSSIFYAVLGLTFINWSLRNSWTFIALFNCRSYRKEEVKFDIIGHEENYQIFINNLGEFLGYSLVIIKWYNGLFSQKLQHSPPALFPKFRPEEYYLSKFFSIMQQKCIGSKTWFELWNLYNR